MKIESKNYDSDLILNIILHCLQKNPNDRPDTLCLLDMIEGRKESEFLNRQSSISNVLEKSKDLVQLNKFTNITRDVTITSKNMWNDGLSLLGIQNENEKKPFSDSGSNIFKESLSVFGFQKEEPKKEENQEEKKNSITSFFW